MFREKRHVMQLRCGIAALVAAFMVSIRDYVFSRPPHDCRPAKSNSASNIFGVKSWKKCWLLAKSNSLPTFLRKKVGKMLDNLKTMLVLDFVTDFSGKKSRALCRALAENRLRDRLFGQKKSSIMSSITFTNRLSSKQTR